LNLYIQRVAKMTDVEEITGMNKEPLISSEVFDYLRNLAIEPYTKLSDIAREQLGDGVRLVSLFPGESFSTYKPSLRVTVLSGKVRLEPAGLDLDLTSTRDRTIHTQDSENRLIAGENSVSSTPCPPGPNWPPMPARPAATNSPGACWRCATPSRSTSCRWNTSCKPCSR
jgi:hypothetical protein